MMTRAPFLIAFMSAAISFAGMSAKDIRAMADTLPEGKVGYVQIGTDFDIGLNGGPTDPIFAVDTAEYY